MSTLGVQPCFYFHWTPAVKIICLQEFIRHLRPRLSSDTQNKRFAKNWSYIQILDTPLNQCVIFLHRYVYQEEIVSKTSPAGWLLPGISSYAQTCLHLSGDDFGRSCGGMSTIWMAQNEILIKFCWLNSKMFFPQYITQTISLMTDIHSCWIWIVLT